MLKNGCILLFVFVQWIHLNNSLTCYFQRCRQTETQEYVCNYHEDVEVECNSGEICYEEANLVNDKILVERNCRSHATIFGTEHNLIETLGKETYTNILDLVYYKYHVITSIDLLNNETQMPLSYRIADNIGCYVQHCYNNCDLGPDAPCYPHPIYNLTQYNTNTNGNPSHNCVNPHPGRKTTCGSELDWVCSTLEIWAGGRFRTARNCQDIDHLENTLRQRIESEETTCVDYGPHPAFHVYRRCYCNSPLCNNF